MVKKLQKQLPKIKLGNDQYNFDNRHTKNEYKVHERISHIVLFFLIYCILYI